MKFCYNMSLTLLNNPKDLDPSYKMDLDFLDCLRRKNPELQIEGVFAFLTHRKWAKTPTVSNRCVKKTPTETRIDAS